MSNIGLEETTGLHIHPHLATVTYLKDCGGPTIILNKIGTRWTKDDLSGKVDDMIISKPIFGKHIKFDGRLLHAAPSDLMEEESNADSEADESGSESNSDIDSDIGGGNNSSNSDLIIKINDPDNSDEITDSKYSNSDSEESESDEGFPKRITFLVNIWLNHIPIQSKPFPEERLKDLKTNISLSSSSSYFQAESSSSFTNEVIPICASSSSDKIVESSLSSIAVPLISLESQFSKPSEFEIEKLKLSSDEYQDRIWNFFNGGHKYQITIPLPFAERFHDLTQKYDAFKLSYGTSNVKARIERVMSSKKKAKLD